MSGFDGKLVVIVGGASGIGLATAQILHSRGATLSIADVDSKAIESAKTGFGSQPPVKWTQVDVSKRQQVDDWIAETVHKCGRIYGAVNAAGVIGKHHGVRSVQELEDEQWDLIIGVNLTGMMHCLRAELGNIEDGGSIVCVSSVQGSMGFAKHAAYSASKHGLNGLCKCAAKEVGERNVRVNMVSPGAIDTPLLRQRDVIVNGTNPTDITTPLARLGTASEVANSIIWLLSPEASFVTGSNLSVDGGWFC